VIEQFVHVAMRPFV